MTDVSQVCDHCGRAVVPIAYGMPGDETIRAVERGEIVLGGCMLPVGAGPSHQCPCGATKRVDMSSTLVPTWDDPSLQVLSDSVRTARYRLLQSWYREAVLGARPGSYKPRGHPARACGSLLHADDVAERPGLNFLDERVAACAAARAVEVQRAAARSRRPG